MGKAASPPWDLFPSKPFEVSPKGLLEYFSKGQQSSTWCGVKASQKEMMPERETVALKPAALDGGGGVEVAKCFFSSLPWQLKHSLNNGVKSNMHIK